MIPQDPESFAKHFLELTEGLNSVGRALCVLLDVPYLEDRENERLLGHRLKEVERENALKQGLLPTRRFKMPDGSILDQDVFPALSENADQLTEEVWSQDNYPESFNTIEEAVQKLPHGIVGAYFHWITRNLVLVGPLRERVGILRTQFQLPSRSMLPGRIAPLMALKKVATA